MKKNKTKADYERYLNQLYGETLGMNEAVEQFEYLASKNRGTHTTLTKIVTYWRDNKLGTLLRKYDPVAFNVSFNDWNGR